MAGWVGGLVVGGNEIKVTQPNLALAWPGLSLATKVVFCQWLGESLSYVKVLPDLYNVKSMFCLLK